MICPVCYKSMEPGQMFFAGKCHWECRGKFQGSDGLSAIQNQIERIETIKEKSDNMEKMLRSLRGKIR